MKELKFRVWMPEAEYGEDDMFYQEDQYLSSFLQRIYSAYEKNHPSQLSFEIEDRLMMFSGLKDSDDNDIYEGDIISFSYGIPPVKVHSEVVFRGARFEVLTPGHTPDSCLLSDLEDVVGEYYVSGNIYEN